MNGALARRIVEDSIRTYFRRRRSRVPQFVDETYSVRGALKLHQHAFGHDLWRAPLNALLAGPQIGLNATAFVLARMGHVSQARTLRSRELFFRTTVAQQLERRIVVDLLELPYSGVGEPSFHDALAIEILGDARLKGALEVLEGPWGEGERLRFEKLMAENLSIYLTGRASVGEVVSAAVTLGAGGFLLHQFTPGILTLGPAIADAVSAKIAGTAAALATGGAVIAATAAATAFAGVVTDPVQRMLGLHHLRLVKLLDALEEGFLGGNARLAIGERYAARLVDLLDAAAAVWAHVRTS
jgi:hypothetical protein